MDLHVLLLCLVASTFTSLSRAAPENLMVMVRTLVSVRRNQKTTLPCWLSPPQSAEDLEIRWYRGDELNTPIMLYRAKTVDKVSQESSYLGRVSFGLKDAESGGLKAGDVTLELINVTLEDAGVYTCNVFSDQHYDKASVRLLVTQPGASPLLSAAWKQDNMVNVSCESEGWYPEPQLRWSDQKQDLIPKVLVYSNDSSGLLSVHSWLLVSSSSTVSCSVGLSGEEAVEGRLCLKGFSHSKQASGSSVAGWVLFAILLIGVFVGVLLFIYRDRILGKKSKSRSHQAEDKTDSEKLLPQDSSGALAEANNFYVNVGLESTNNQFILTKGNKLRDKQCEYPDGQRVTCITAVKGTSGFSSGKHYWEVSLGNTEKNIDLKQSWWVGVTSNSAIPQDYNVCPSVENGFWLLFSKAGTFQFSTNPAVSLPVHSRPQTVGVYLNYDSGELSFYNVEKKSLIGTFMAKFTDEVFPLFNPGKGDKAPMEIIQRPAEGEPNDMVNSTAQHTV